MTRKMAITLIIVGGFLLIIGLILSLKSIKPIYLNVISGLVIIIGTFFGLFGKQLQDISSSEKSDKILKTGASTEEKVDYLKIQNIELASKANELRDKAEAQAVTIDELRKENTELYAKLANSSRDIYHNLTGGDSYCTLTIGNIDESKTVGSLIFMLGDNNKSPLRNLQVRIVDLNTFDAEKMTLEDSYKNLINLEAVEPNKAVFTPYKFLLDKNKGVNLNVFFSASNGFFTQLIRMRYVGDRWASATIVEREGKQLFEKIDKSYPEQNKNKIFN